MGTHSLPCHYLFPFDWVTSTLTTSKLDGLLCDENLQKVAICELSFLSPVPSPVLPKGWTPTERAWSLDLPLLTWCL